MSGYPVVIQGPSGALKTYIMAPAVQASANFGNNKECISDATGFKLVQILALGFTTVSAEALVAAFSTSAADQAAVKAICDEIAMTTTGKYDAPDGIANDNAVVLPLNTLTPVQITLEWDGTNPIKTIGFELTGVVSGLQLAVHALRVS